MRAVQGLFFAFLLAFNSARVSADPGVTESKILVGQSAAFSGPAAQLGIQMHAGAKAYFDHVNAIGGVFGRKIELIKRDDQYEAELAAANTKT